MRLNRRSLFAALAAPLLPWRKLAVAAPIPGTYGALTRDGNFYQSATFSNLHTSALDVELCRKWLDSMKQMKGQVVASMFDSGYRHPRG